jgi:hypothetical protein
VPDAPLVIRVDHSIGPFAYPKLRFSLAVRAFGAPLIRDDLGTNLCQVTWPELGLRMGFASRPPACDHLVQGAWYGATAYSPRPSSRASPRRASAWPWLGPAGRPASRITTARRPPPQRQPAGGSACVPQGRTQGHTVANRLEG